MKDRLILGTAQLGMPYGINNELGQPDFKDSCRIITTAFDQGIERFDTAQAYGESEEILGKILDKFKLSEHAKIYSKINPKIDCCDKDTVYQSVEESLKKLGVEQLEGLLLHHEEQLSSWNQGLGTIMKGLVQEGLVKSIGASFYTPQKALAALDIKELDIYQVPANILDQRFEDAGVFKKASEQGKNVFVRSIFLQGLLLMPLERVPPSMQEVLPYLEKVEEMAQAMHLSRHDLLMVYAAKEWPNSSVLFGAENSVQVVDNVRAFLLKTVSGVDRNIFKNVPENILNPMLWPVNK